MTSDITADDIAALQRKRQMEGLSGRQINCEIARSARFSKGQAVDPVAEDVKFLHEREDTGRAPAPNDEVRLLEAMAQSALPALYPFFILSLDVGLRPSETRALTRRDLNLDRRDDAIAKGEIVVGRSKTKAATGRVVPLARRARAALTSWLARFPSAAPGSYVFPLNHVSFAMIGHRPRLWAVNLNRPMGTYSYKRAYKTACTRAGVDFRFYDARHTFVTRLAEHPIISEETIRQRAGHVSHRMLARYAHIRSEARRNAIATLETRDATSIPILNGVSTKSPTIAKNQWIGPSIKRGPNS